MSKRKTQEESDLAVKKSKDTPLHSSSCEDPECTGCEDGEIDINPGTKDPFELYGMAKQEQNSTSQEYNADTQRRIVLKLYELALDAFEHRMDSTSKPNASVQVAYAKCLHDFGEFNQTLEHLEKALQLAQELVRASKDTKHQLLFASFNIDLIQQAVLLEQDSQSERILSSGRKFIQDAITSIENLQATNLLAESSQKQSAILSLLTIVDLAGYTDELSDVLVDDDIMKAILLAHKIMNRFHDMGDDTSDKYLGAKLMYAYVSRIGDSEINETVMEDVYLAIGFLESYVSSEDLSDDERVAGFQLLSALYLESVNFYADDDDAMKAAQNAVGAIKRALELYPDDEDLIQQYAELQGAEDLDEGSDADYEDVGEDAEEELNVE